MNAASRRVGGRPGSRIPGTVLVILALMALAAIAFVRFFPADRLRGQFERRVSEASGYAVTVGDLDLGWSGLGVALVAHDLVAISADGGQRFEAPVARMRVALMPLLKRNIVVSAASADGALLAIGPATRGAPAPPPRPRPRAAGSSRQESRSPTAASPRAASTESPPCTACR